jgi:hypothetical protein
MRDILLLMFRNASLDVLPQALAASFGRKRTVGTRTRRAARGGEGGRATKSAGAGRVTKVCVADLASGIFELIKQLRRGTHALCAILIFPRLQARIPAESARPARLKKDRGAGRQREFLGEPPFRLPPEQYPSIFRWR